MTKNQNNNIEDYNIINIKVDNKEQVISKFSYDENDKLNKELSEFILDKSKIMLLNKDIKLNFYSSSPIDKTEIQTTLHNHFREEYLEVRHELKRSNIFTIAMIILGVISLTMLILAHKFFDNFYTSTLLEIASWVFMWEAVDSLFLQRPRLKRKCLLMQKLYSARVDIMVSQ